MKKIVTIVGARPQFVKASIVSNNIKIDSDIVEHVVHTGQHYADNMSRVFFDELQISAPKYNLGINGLSHGEMTGRMLIAIEKILQVERPDILLVYGDTNSTLAGALAAAKLKIPVAHVEAGLRCFDSYMPEEINRILTDRISEMLFAPTDAAVRNLKKDGFNEEKIFNVGDVMFDLVKATTRLAEAKSTIFKKVAVRKKGYILATIHRAENTDNEERLGCIVEALLDVAKVMPILWPIHPRTETRLKSNGMWPLIKSSLEVIDPVGYFDMLMLQRYASVIATDSGGIQKEAFFHEVPCVTIREHTEWTELVDSGWNKLVPPTKSEELAFGILGSINRQGIKISPYGDGNSAKKIVQQLK